MAAKSTTMEKKRGFQLLCSLEVLGSLAGLVTDNFLFILGKQHHTAGKFKTATCAGVVLPLQPHWHAQEKKVISKST